MFKRRALEKNRRPLRCSKKTENIYNSTLLYLKFLLVWGAVLLADFLLGLRFEYLWPFWLFLHSVYDTYKFQGLAFSLFFSCLSVTSDVLCFLFIPVQWVLFLASSYVWIQYVWHTERGICFPTVALWLLFVYVEAAIRLKDLSKDMSFPLDLCRPFAAHSVGYPVVTLGFGFKSYVSYKLRIRKQHEVQKENDFYFQLLRNALPVERQHDEQQQQLVLSGHRHDADNNGERIPNGFGPVSNGTAAPNHRHPSNQHESSIRSFLFASTGGGGGGNSTNPSANSSPNQKTDRSCDRGSNSTTSNPVHNTPSTNTGGVSGKSKLNSHVITNNLLASERSPPVNESRSHVPNSSTATSTAATAATASELQVPTDYMKKSGGTTHVNDFKDDSFSVSKTAYKKNDTNSRKQQARASAAAAVGGGGDAGSNAARSSSEGSQVGSGGKKRNNSQQQNQHQNHNSANSSEPNNNHVNDKSATTSDDPYERLDRLEGTVKCLSADLQASRLIEQDLRSKLSVANTSDRQSKREVEQLQSDKDGLEKRLQDLVAAKQAAHSSLSGLEKRLEQERKAREAAEKRLLEEKSKQRRTEDEVARAVAEIAKKNECSSTLCGKRAKELEQEVAKASTELRLKADLLNKMEQELQGVRKLKDDMEQHMMRLNEQNARLDSKLKDENRHKVDLFAALNDLRRKIINYEAELQAKEKELCELRNHYAESFSLGQNVANSSQAAAAAAAAAAYISCMPNGACPPQSLGSPGPAGSAGGFFLPPAVSGAPPMVSRGAGGGQGVTHMSNLNPDAMACAAAAAACMGLHGSPAAAAAAWPNHSPPTLSRPMGEKQLAACTVYNPGASVVVSSGGGGLGGGTGSPSAGGGGSNPGSGTGSPGGGGSDQ